MNSKTNTEQHYALNPERQLVCIRTVNHNVKYTCVNCGGEMIPKQGKVREWHFAHKTLSDNCSNESYLHSLAKKKIYDWFCNADKFEISLNAQYKCSQINNCIWFDNEMPGYCELKKPYIINLKEFYNSCCVEQTYEKFRADLFLYDNQSDKPPIFIEICVNHSCSNEKINSRIRIIEIVIKSEKDIESIINSTLCERDYRIRLYNFIPKPQIIDSSYKELIKYVLFKSDRGFCVDTNCKTYMKRNPQSIFELTIDNIDGIKEYSIYEIGLAIAYKYDYPVCSCFLCKYHKINKDMCICDDDERLYIFCCLYKKMETNKYCKSTRALECKAFKVDKKFCDAIDKLIRYSYFEIWERKDELST